MSSGFSPAARLLSFISIGVLSAGSLAAAAFQPAISIRSGSVYGGHSPLVGATVRLYEIGHGGYGSAATVLGTATSDNSGNFDIPNFNCSSPDAQLYLTAAGGDAGSGQNTAIALIAAVGPCSNLPSFAVINELSTAATVYAFTQFMSPANAKNIGAPASNTVGPANAASVVAAFFDYASGGLGSLLSGSAFAATTQKLDTVADILAACVDSSGASSSECTSLFTAATPPGGTAPKNTLQATLNIALNPVSNISQLYSLVSQNVPSPPFEPILSKAPLTWLLSMVYTGTTAQAPRKIAVDGSGIAWLTYSDSTGGGGLLRISPNGTVVGPFTNGLNQPYGDAIDTNGNIWVVNNGSNSIVALNPNGGLILGPISGLNLPTDIVTDQSGNVWVTNTGAAALVEYDINGNIIQTVNNVGQSHNLAVDKNGSIWTADYKSGAGNSVAKITGSSVQKFTGVPAAFSVATDTSGNAWFGSADSNTRIVGLDNSGSPLPGSPFTGGGTGPVAGIAIDGHGNVWASDATTRGLTELSPNGTAISPAPGYRSSTLYDPTRLAIDPSGNLWIADTNANAVTEFIGAAGPVKTPVIGPPVLP